MGPKYSFSICTTILISLPISYVRCMPHSPGTKTIQTDKSLPNVENSSSKYPPFYKPIKSRQFGGGELPAPPVMPKYPPLPSFNLPHKEYKAQLERFMETFNAGLKIVADGFHGVVHEGLAGVLGGLDHDAAFITAADPNMFKDMIAKYDEKQAAKQRHLAKNIVGRYTTPMSIPGPEE